MEKKKNNTVNDDTAECKALLIRLTVAVEELLQIIRMKKPLSAEELLTNGR